MESREFQPTGQDVKQVATGGGALNKVLRIGDRISELLGSIGWLQVLALTYVVVQEVILRYFFSAPTMWGYDVSVMLAGSVCTTWAVLELKNQHLRVDAFYQGFSLRKKALADVIGATIMGFPALGFMIYSAVKYTIRAYQINERMAYLSFWYPPAAPFRTVVCVSLILTVIEMINVYIRDWYMVIKGKKLC